MAEYTVIAIEDIEGIWGGGFKRARSALGVTSFGMQIIEMPGGADRYPEHDHSSDGQEEVYVTLAGSGEIQIDGQRHPLDAEHLVSVKAGTMRKVFAGDDGLRLLVIGGVPGAAYEVQEFTEVGAPDPSAKG